MPEEHNSWDEPESVTGKSWDASWVRPEVAPVTSTNSSAPEDTEKSEGSSDRILCSPNSSDGQQEEEEEVKVIDDGELPKISKKQTVEQLREALEKMGLSSKGKKETLYKRAAHHVQSLAAASAYANYTPWSASTSPAAQGEGDNPWDCGDFPSTSVLAAHFAEKEARREERRLMRESGQKYKSFLVFDVEATCRGGKEFDYPNEIIEFPVVLLRWGQPNAEGKRILEKVDHFRSYVKPTWRPELTDFCKSLTGISQETVDASPTFPDVVRKLEEWLDKWDLRGDKGLKDALWVTDGPWDLRDFVPKQLHITPLNPHPNYFHGPYINIKHAVKSVMGELSARRAYAAAHPDNAANERATQPMTTSKRFGKWRPGNGAAPYGQNEEAVTGPLIPGAPAIMTGKKQGDYYLNIAGMCEALGLGEFEGRQHSGLDDATNISRIVIALSTLNVVFEHNSIIQPIGSGKRYPWMAEKGVVWAEWMSSQRPQDDPAKKMNGASEGVPTLTKAERKKAAAVAAAEEQAKKEAEAPVEEEWDDTWVEEPYGEGEEEREPIDPGPTDPLMFLPRIVMRRQGRSLAEGGKSASTTIKPSLDE